MLQIVRSMYAKLKEGEIKILAAGLAFSTVLSLVPYLAVIFSLMRWFGGQTKTFAKIETLILANFAGPLGDQGLAIFRKLLDRLSAASLGSVGALLLFLTALRLVRDMEFGIHRIWGIKERRPWIKRTAIQTAFLVLIPFGSAIYLGFFGARSLLESSQRILPGKGLVLVFLVLFSIYKWLPARRVNWAVAALGSALATSLLYAQQLLFGLITTKVFNYSKIYGSLAAFPVFLIWILLLWYIVLLGAALCASIHRSSRS